MFEVDSGSHLSTINVSELNKIKGATIKPTLKKAKGYGNNVIKFKGEVNLKIKYAKNYVTHDFLVVDNCHVSLLGRDLCSKLNIKMLFPDVNVINNMHDNIFSKYKDYLSEDFQSSVNDSVSFKIDSNAVPVYCKARPVPFRYKELVKKELERLESIGVISKVYQSEWACPSVNVLKSNNKIRICGDYSKTINMAMKTVQYPLPSIEEVLGQVGDAKVFSKLDCHQAYLQLPLSEESKQYTTINTCHGLFQWNFLPFGVASSPAIFQSFISRILSGISNVIIYQDDILVLTANHTEHNHVLDEVLSRLYKAGIKLNVNKCLFFTDSVSYLGHEFSKDGVSPSSKVRAIIDAPMPTTTKQVQSFLGLCTFYNRFIPHFSDILTPLYDLLKKNTKFHWSSKHDNAVLTIKELFKGNKILRLFNPKLDTALETDASSCGLGAVLMQRHDNVWYPVQFASRMLNKAERNYSQIEREALSVIFGCERFRQYLLGSHFTLKNDHKPLLKLFSSHSSVPQNCSSRLIRWALRLNQYNFDFQYIKGQDNLNSDFLSRLPLQETEPIQEPNEFVFVIETMNDTPVTFHDIQMYTDSDPNLQMIKSYIKHGFPSKIHHSLSEFKSNSNELTILKDCIMYKNRVFVPKPLRSTILNQFHQTHPGISAMKSMIRALVWYPGVDRDVTNIVKNCKQCHNVLARPPQNCHIEWPTPQRNWSRLHIDHFFFENYTCLVIIDALSKYIECEIVKSTSSAETINVLREVFSRNGLPDTIVSDNATSFSSYEFKDFLDKNCIVHVTPPPYSPSSNGQAERAVRVIKDLLKKNVNGNFKLRLLNVLLYYRTVPHSATKVSPCTALNNRSYVTLKEKVNPRFLPDVKPKLNNKNIPIFKEGDNVLALNFHNGPKWYSASVLKVLGKNIYNVYVHELNTVWKRHKHQLLSANSKSNENDVPNCAEFPSKLDQSSQTDIVLRRSSRLMNK